MRIPFLSRKQPEDLREVMARATFVPSHELAWPQLRDQRTFEELQAATERRRRILNGDSPS